MSKVTKARQAEAEEAREYLRKLLPPGSSVYTIVRHVARSGMMRVVDAYAIDDGEPRWLSGQIVKAIPNWERFDERRQGIRMSGCGMDMGFHLVSTLARVLYPDGFECVGERCPSNDHNNDRGKHRGRQHHRFTALNGTKYDRKVAGQCKVCGHYGDDCIGDGSRHASGDYALRHRWI